MVRDPEELFESLQEGQESKEYGEAWPDKAWTGAL